MKTNAATLTPILESDNLSFFSIVEFNWNSNYYFTDLGYDITYDGNTYLSDHPIIGLDKIRYTNIVDRSAFNLSLSGLNQDMLEEIALGITNKPVIIKLVYLVDNVPQTGNNEVMEVYDGLVSKPSISTTNNTKTIQIECTSPLRNLDETGTLFTTRDGIKIFNENDTSFDQVSDDSQETSIKWGKK